MAWRTKDRVAPAPKALKRSTMTTIMISEPEFENFAAGVASATGISTATLGLFCEIQTSAVVRNAHRMPRVGKICRLGTNCVVEMI
jgi:hypothetical protein